MYDRSEKQVINLLIAIQIDGFKSVTINATSRNSEFNCTRLNIKDLDQAELDIEISKTDCIIYFIPNDEQLRCEQVRENYPNCIAIDFTDVKDNYIGCLDQIEYLIHSARSSISQSKANNLERSTLFMRGNADPDSSLFCFPKEVAMIISEAHVNSNYAALSFFKNIPKGTSSKNISSDYHPTF